MFHQNIANITCKMENMSNICQLFSGRVVDIAMALTIASVFLANQRAGTYSLQINFGQSQNSENSSRDSLFFPIMSNKYNQDSNLDSPMYGIFLKERALKHTQICRDVPRYLHQIRPPNRSHTQIDHQKI